MTILGFLLLTGLLFRYEYIRIRRYGGGGRELLAFSVLMVVAVGLGVAMILGLPIPNPTRGIEAIFKPLSHLIMPK